MSSCACFIALLYISHPLVLTLKVLLFFCLQHFGQPPLPAYEPAFDWENERAMIFGQRTPESPAASYSRFFCMLLCFTCSFFEKVLYFWSLYYLHSGLKISVRVLSLAFQSGLVGENSD